jgi:hypothetical protein
MGRMAKKELVVLVFVRGALVGRLVLVKSPDSKTEVRQRWATHQDRRRNDDETLGNAAHCSD